MGSEVQDGVSLEDLLEVRVVCRESVVGAGGLGKKESHGVSLVPERRLDTDEDISELLSVDDEVLAVRVEVSRRRAPVLLKILGVWRQLVVLVSVHSVGDVELWRVDASLGIVEHALHDEFLRVRGVSDVVSFGLELLKHGLDRVEDVEVSGSAHVALVRREGEDGNGDVLVGILLGAKGAPLHGTVGEEVDAVGKRNRAAGGSLAAGVDDGLNGSVNLRQRDLESDLCKEEILR